MLLRAVDPKESERALMLLLAYDKHYNADAETRADENVDERTLFGDLALPGSWGTPDQGHWFSIALASKLCSRWSSFSQTDPPPPE